MVMSTAATSTLHAPTPADGKISAARGADAAPGLLEAGAELLSPIEKQLIKFVQRTFYSPRWDRAVRVAQRRLGALWIERVMSNVRVVHGIERLPDFDPAKSYIVVSNHRSFFDLFVITGFLVYRDLLRHRILFPVRSKFFYDNALGLAVNGIACFFAMYPPVFRERKRAALNHATLDETTRLLRKGGFFVGLHPEGQRNLADDAYALLPARSGVGRVMHGCDAVVIPVFINGLCNDAAGQVLGNFNGKGDRVNVVFGNPLDCSELRAKKGCYSVYRALSSAALESIRVLGEEERAIRAGNA
jgi:1-acyl-sn-glycerol-3-phosphate acyltransferase